MNWRALGGKSREFLLQVADRIVGGKSKEWKEPGEGREKEGPFAGAVRRRKPPAPPGASWVRKDKPPKA